MAVRIGGIDEVDTGLEASVDHGCALRKIGNPLRVGEVDGT
jgi:hypothetical protein